RDGLTWSDGHPLTVDDVLFTWHGIIKAGLGNPSTRDTVLVDGKFPEVSQVDTRRVRFKTPRPFAPFLRMLATSIAPKHVFKAIIEKGGDRAFSAAYGVQAAIDHPESFVSSGMWRLDRYVAGERVIFKRNPHFFMLDTQGQRLPYLDFYAVRFVKDLNNAVLQFELGTLDSLSVPARFVNYLMNTTHQDFTLNDLGPTSGTTFVALNLSTRKNEDGKAIVDPIRSAWFRQTPFRQALDYAVDRTAMVENILLGAGVALFLPETPASIFAHPVLSKGHPQNLQKARALLKSAGFRWNRQGALIDAKGHPVTFTLITNAGNDERESAGVALQHDWAKLGIAVKLQPIDFNVLVSRMGNGQWEAVLLGLTGSPLEPHGGANVFMSRGALHLYNQQDPKKPPVGLLPWEADIDKAFMAGAASLDFKTRQAAYWRFQDIVYRNQPMIYLFAPRQVVAIRKRLENVDPTPLGVWHNLESVWIRQ
ncbi:MAG: ABC transporter substrate-binding protein, partial [Vampirovibrionales bacterium]|nr:ABC transporter substrate-binding protein [Vampirovibrionales bacterium]